MSTLTPTLSQNKLSATYGLDVLLTMLAPIFWGTTYIVTTQFLPPDKPLFAALMRVLPAGLLLLLFTRRLPQSGQWDTSYLTNHINISSIEAYTIRTMPSTVVRIK